MTQTTTTQPTEQPKAFTAKTPKMTEERFAKCCAYFKQLVLLRQDTGRDIMTDTLCVPMFEALADDAQRKALVQAYNDWFAYRLDPNASPLFNSEAVEVVRKRSGIVADALDFLFSWLRDFDGLLRTDSKNPENILKERKNDKIYTVDVADVDPPATPADPPATPADPPAPPADPPQS